MFWPATSLSMVASSSRAARREYSGSSAISAAAVWMEMESSSRVEAPSKRPPMVLLATRMGSTCGRPWQQRCDGADDLVDVDGFERRRCACAPASGVRFGWGKVGIEFGERRLQSLPRCVLSAPEIQDRRRKDDSAEETATDHRDPPLGGVCNSCPFGTAHGRSSDLQATYLLQLPSPWLDQCFIGAFVPAYRCGAVPDSHRIPFSV